MIRVHAAEGDGGGLGAGAEGVETDTRLFLENVLDKRKFRLVKLFAVNDGDGLSKRVSSGVCTDAHDGDGRKFLCFGFLGFLCESR